jgi:hypothetical protein
VKAAPKSDWVHVLALKPGTNVSIRTHDHGKVRCAVAAVEDDSITCGGAVLMRSSIESIKGSHKLRSTMVGFGVAVGASAAVTAVIAASCKVNNSDCLGGAAIAAIIDLSLFIATPIVFGVYDLTAGTIYKAATP